MQDIKTTFRKYGPSSVTRIALQVGCKALARHICAGFTYAVVGAEAIYCIGVKEGNLGICIIIVDGNGHLHIRSLYIN